jgi:hypothetical protein
MLRRRESKMRIKEINGKNNWMLSNILDKIVYVCGWLYLVGFGWLVIDYIRTGVWG